jgi:hypothetical protein
MCGCNTVGPLAAQGWKLVSIGGRTAEACSESCRYRWNKRAAAMGQPQAVVVTEGTREASTWLDTPIGAPTTREVTLTCTRCGGRLPPISQTRQNDAWSPDLSRVAETSGWILVGSHSFCSRRCAGVHPRDLPAVAGDHYARVRARMETTVNGKPAPVVTVGAAEHVNDVSYQKSRAQAFARLAPAPPTALEREIGGREIPDAKPARKGR